MNLHSMMEEMQNFQKNLQNASFTGTSGGGMVKITLLGNGVVKKIHIEKTLLVPQEVEVLEDLVVAAFNNAKSEIEANISSTMSKYGIPSELFKVGL